MKKFTVYVVCILSLTLSLSMQAIAESEDFSANDLQRMSIFLSNFTELGLENFTAKDLFNSPEKLIYFGVWHNYINNYRSRIVPCKKNCTGGSLLIATKYVQESVQKYFNYTLKEFVNVDNDGQKFVLQGQSYNFEGASGEMVYHVRVDSAKKLASGLIEMKGMQYAVDMDDTPGLSVYALAKPFVWNGKNTWYIRAMWSGEGTPPAFNAADF